MEIEKRKCISVTFVKDEDVIQHILHVEDKKAGKKLTAPKRKLIYSEGACKSARKRILGSGSGFTNIEDGCSDEEDILKHVSALNIQDGNLPGQEVFSFRTPKRAGQMAQKALNTSHTTTPKTLRNKKGSRNGEVFQKQVPVAGTVTSLSQSYSDPPICKYQNTLEMRTHISNCARTHLSVSAGIHALSCASNQKCKTHHNMNWSKIANDVDNSHSNFSLVSLLWRGKLPCNKILSLDSDVIEKSLPRKASCEDTSPLAPILLRRNKQMELNLVKGSYSSTAVQSFRLEENSCLEKLSIESSGHHCELKKNGLDSLGETISFNSDLVPGVLVDLKMSNSDVNQILDKKIVQSSKSECSLRSTSNVQYRQKEFNTRSGLESIVSIGSTPVSDMKLVPIGSNPVSDMKLVHIGSTPASHTKLVHIGSTPLSHTKLVHISSTPMSDKKLVHIGSTPASHTKLVPIGSTPVSDMKLVHIGSTPASHTKLVPIGSNPVSDMKLVPIGSNPVSDMKLVHISSTPVSHTKLKILQDEETSQQNQNSTSLRQAPQNTTPYRLRKRNADDQSSDDSIDETTSDADSEEEVAKMGKGRQTIEATRNVEEYFDLHAAPGVTSDRTMSRLELPQMDIEVLRDILQKTVTSHSKLQKSLCDKHHKLFRSWMYNMCNGFNLLLYGLGSKRELLEMFEKEYLSNFSHLVVNGYFPSLTIKQILNSITEDIFHHKGSFRSPLDQLDFIKSLFETKTHQDFFILCNSIDGAMLRGEKTQNILSLLAQIRGIHFIASVDHINAPLVWDQTKCSRFNWLWYDVTTFNRYIAETSYENSLLVQQSGGLALKSLAHVMRSLTPNARKIFQLLAHYQLENSDNSSFIGMSFQDLYIRCRELFLVNSDQTLRAQLVEFRDHKLIRSRKNYDGGEYLLVPIEIQALKEFLEQDDFN